MGKAAVLDVYIANAAGSFAPDAYAGKDGVGEGAVSDAYVLGWPMQRKAFLAAAGFERDAIVAGGDIAVIDPDAAAGIDVDAVAVAAGAADSEAKDNNVFAVRGMDGPHALVTGGEVFEPDIVAADEFNQRRVTKWILNTGAATERRVSDNVSRAADTEVAGVDGVDESYVAGGPFALPAHLSDGVIGKVWRALKDSALVEAEQRVAAKRDSAGEVIAGGHEDLASTQDRTAIDGPLDRCGVLGGAVARCAKVADIES